MKIRSFRDLDVWRKAMNLAEQTYMLVSRFPNEERYGLSAQLRRCSVSIPSNIAEGAGCGMTKRYVHHLRIARGSEQELQTQLELAWRLGFAKQEAVMPLLDSAAEVGRMLNGLISSLEAQEVTDP